MGRPRNEDERCQETNSNDSHLCDARHRAGGWEAVPDCGVLILHAPPPMLTINKLIPKGHGLAPVLVKRAPTVSLDWDTRQKSRFDAQDSQGRSLGVFLPRGTTVRG